MMYAKGKWISALVSIGYLVGTYVSMIVENGEWFFVELEWWNPES